MEGARERGLEAPSLVDNGFNDGVRRDEPEVVIDFDDSATETREEGPAVLSVSFESGRELDALRAGARDMVVLVVTDDFTEAEDDFTASDCLPV